MLNKSKINISVILLTIGIGLIPTGFITNGFIRDQVRENIPSTLLHIQEEAVSEIEAQYLGLGITEVLPEIQKEGTENIKDEIVEVQFIPSTLLYLKNLTVPLFLERLNGSMSANLIDDSLTVISEIILDNINGPLSAQIINDTLWQVMNSNSTNSTFARDVFFNNYTFQVDFDVSINGTSINGVSEYITTSSNSLNYTATAQQRLLDGYLSYPGLIEDVENGTGILEFIELYENATNDPVSYNITTIQTDYNATWSQITSLANYVTNYLWDSRVPLTWNNTMTPTDYATTRSRELFFNDESWSSTTNNITPIEGISEYGTGGLNNLSYTTLAQQRILLGYGNVPGILRNKLLGQGLLDYLEYYAETSGNATIQSQYNATYYQLNNLTTYLTQYLIMVIVPAQLALEGLTLETAGLRDFYEQWANASFFTDGIKINELSADIGDLLKARSAALEIRKEINSLTTSINETTATDLFFNNYTFQVNFSTTIKGVSEYISNGNYSLNYTDIAQQRLLDGHKDFPGIFTSIDSGFGLLNWLDFYDSAYLNIGTNRTLMETTYNATWSTQLLPFGQYIWDYLLGTIIATIVQRGVEAGIPTVTNINYNTTVDLWDPLNSNGIVNDTGILKWYKAANGNQTVQDQLNSTFNLTQNQFNLLYNWLIIEAKNKLTPTVFIIQQPLGIRLTTDEYAGILFLEQWANATVIPIGMEIGDTVYHGSPDWFGDQNIGDQNAAQINWIDGESLVGNSYSEIVTAINGHRKVLELHHDGTAGSNEFVHNYPNGAEVSGIRELWWGTSDIAESNEIIFRDTAINHIKLRINESRFQEYSGGSYNNISGAPIPAKNKLYHFKIEYDTLTDTYNLWIDRNQVLTNQPFASIGINIDNVMVSLNSAIAYSMYIDAWGDPNDSDYIEGDNILPGIKGSEVGIPIKSDISYNTVAALFDTENSSSFIDNIGILKWIDAYNGDLVAKNELIVLFGLDSTQMNMTLNWLFTSFRQTVVPNVLTDLTGFTTISLAGLEFHRQWANHTLFVDGIDLDPAFGLDSSITAWELGIPGMSNILDDLWEVRPSSTSEDLWDEQNSFSLVHRKGNGLWFMAALDNSAYNTLKEYHELDDTEMEAIIAWVERINEEYSLPHLKEKLNLPTDVYTYANTVSLGFIIGSAIFLGLGCINIILIFLSKRRS